MDHGTIINLDKDYVGGTSVAFKYPINIAVSEVGL